MSKLNGIARLFWRPAEEEAEDSVLTEVEENSARARRFPADTSQYSTGLHQALLGLRDVDGVLGSLAVGVKGDLMAQDLPARFTNDAGERLAARMRQLRDALSYGGGRPGPVDLRFAELRLQVTPVEGGLVGVLADQTANSPALNMALSIAARSVEEQLNENL